MLVSLIMVNLTGGCSKSVVRVAKMTSRSTLLLLAVLYFACSSLRAEDNGSNSNANASQNRTNNAASLSLGQGVEPGLDAEEQHGKLGDALLREGKFKQAISEYENALQYAPHSSTAQNNLAWALATIPPDQGGDPNRALTLARQACERTNFANPSTIDTLAAAYAANGEFPEAVRMARTAIDLATATGRDDVAKDIEGRLALYKDQKPYRLPPSGSAPTQDNSQTK